MAVRLISSVSNYIGSSGDTKPTGVRVGSTFYETDTTNKYICYDGTNWVLDSRTGSGSTSKMSTTLVTDNKVLTTSDFGKCFLMNTALEKSFSLPSVAASNIGSLIRLGKISTGKVNIVAADADIIDDSSAGGTIYNSELVGYPFVDLQLITATLWIKVGGSGSWTST